MLCLQTMTTIQRKGTKCTLLIIVRNYKPVAHQSSQTGMLRWHALGTQGLKHAGIEMEWINVT
jgi:hypothetical protein